MSPEQVQEQRRWHDNQGELSTLIDLLDSIPEPIRPLIAEALTTRANQDFDAILDSLKSLGKEKIMAMHQAAKKRRSYDQDPNLHQIANTFMVLPEAERPAFAARFLEFTSLMVDYLADCDSFNLTPKESDLRHMRDLFIEQSEEAVRDYLLFIHNPYYELMAKELPEVLVGTPGIEVTDEGMLIRERASE